MPGSAVWYTLSTLRVRAHAEASIYNAELSSIKPVRDSLESSFNNRKSFVICGRILTPSEMSLKITLYCIRFLSVWPFTVGVASTPGSVGSRLTLVLRGRGSKAATRSTHPPWYPAME